VEDKKQTQVLKLAKNVFLLINIWFDIDWWASIERERRSHDDSVDFTRVC
jgi:hypothetical protein